MPAQSPTDCDQVEYLGGEPGYPLRLPNTTAVLAEEYRPLPSSDDIPWWADAHQVVEARAQKYLIAQPVPIRSPMIGVGRPQCAPTPELATAVELEKEAEEAGEKVGQRYGEVLGTIEKEIDFLAHGWAHDGVLLKRILSNPDERDALLKAFAKELDEVPELPTYSDEALARKALAGFDKGYRAGIDAAHLRAFLIDASADVFFMVIGGIAGALESAGAKILDTALMRIRSMPIFVPGTVGGAGFFMKVARRAVQGSSRKLLRNMLAAGTKVPLEGEVPHHIVSHTDVRAAEARKILADFDVGLDADANGVFLPGTVKAPNPKGKAVHSTVHTNAYYRILENELKDAATKEEVIKILQDIATRLEHGGF